MSAPFYPELSHMGVHLRKPLANVLPRDAQMLLRRSASIDLETPIGQSPARSKALEAAIAQIKRRFPEFFKKDSEL